MIKALLCDLDGTIIDTLWLYPKAYDIALEKFGFHFNKKEIAEKCFGKTEESICESLGISQHVAEFKELYFAAAGRFSEQAELFPGVLDILDLAKEKGIKLAVISFAYKWYLERMVSRFNLGSYFNAVISHDDVPNAKPAPDGVIKAGIELEVKANECIMFGDSKNDILMGKNAGTKTALLFPDKYGEYYDFQALKHTQPDYIISDWQQVKEIL